MTSRSGSNDAGQWPGGKKATTRLLAFLPPESQDRLLDNITALSAPGSRFAAENMSNAGGTMATIVELTNQAVDRWRQHGFDVGMTDLQS